MSQESGIPTFRGKDGLWRNYDPMKIATIDAFYENPKLVWEWYEERRKISLQQSQILVIRLLLSLNDIEM